MDKADIWAALAAPLAPNVIQWRQDGRPTVRDGRHIARFVAYIDAQTVRDRLDAVVPGEWDVTLEMLPPVSGLDEDANQGICNFKARLQILGVIRESVGTGKDYKQADSDAFKRAAVRFGIGHELYAMDMLWVQMDGDGKYAKPIEDPAVAYARKHGRNGVRPVADGGRDVGVTAQALSVPEPQRGEAASGTDEVSATANASRTDDEQSCPKCGGRTWDNRLTKRNPKAPDYKCRDRSCDGVIWPPKPGRQNAATPVEGMTEQEREAEWEEIPF